MNNRSRRRRTRREKPGPAGFLVLDKPAGCTSHDMVDVARRWLGTRRVGHLGTLDPQATGVLPLAVREATKLISHISSEGKSYVGTVRLGAETDTLDGQGQVLRRHRGELPAEEDVLRGLSSFRGEIEQIPPMYSAVKQGGVPLHRLARQGEEVERAPKKVRIDRLDLLRFAPPDVEIAVDCSPGTYVRVLAADLGEALGCGAYLESLSRTRSGPFTIDQALSPARLDEEAQAGTLERCLIPPAEAMDLPVITLASEAASRVLHGGDVSPGSGLRQAPGARLIAVDQENRLLALLELRPDRRLWPVRVLRGS